MQIIDGGIGSEMDLRLEASANKDSTWCACHHSKNPTTLQKVYEDYIASGANILSANTYSILQYLLKMEAQEVEQSVHLAVQLIKNAKNYDKSNILIAGCVSAHNSIDVPDDQVYESIRLLAHCLVKSRVDYILVEMVQSLHKGKLMVKAADTANLPMMIGFSVILEDNTLKLKHKDAIFDEKTIIQILGDAQNIDSVGIMHSNVHVLDASLSVIEKVWSGHLHAYPDCGVFENNIWKTDATDAVMNSILETLLDCKTKHPRLMSVGGCCGLGPTFIDRLTSTFRHV